VRRVGPCSHCKVVKPLKAKESCSPCYAVHHMPRYACAQCHELRIAATTLENGGRLCFPCYHKGYDRSVVLEDLMPLDWTVLLKRISDQLGPPDHNGCTVWRGTTKSSYRYPVLFDNHREYSVRHVILFYTEQVSEDRASYLLPRCSTPSCCTLEHFFTTRTRRRAEQFDDVDWKRFWTYVQQHTERVQGTDGCLTWTGLRAGNDQERERSLLWPYGGVCYWVRPTMHFFFDDHPPDARIYTTCDTPQCMQMAHQVNAKDKKKLGPLKLAWMRSNSKVDKDTGCVLWQGVQTHGYGQTGFMGRQWRVHRLSWMLQRSEIPAGMIVRHDKDGKRCTSPACWNVDHLSVGTQRDNAADKVAAGTDNRGERHPHASTTDEIALQVKLSKGQGTQQQRADRFSVSLHVVSSIDSGLAWCHLPDASGRVDEDAVARMQEKRRTANESRRDAGSTPEDYENCHKRMMQKATKQASGCIELPIYMGQPYPTMSFSGRNRPAHKIVFELFHNDCMPMHGYDEIVRHMCHNKACVNPEHLTRGTRSDNIIDTLSDGLHANSKMLEHVHEVRALLAKGATVAQLAAKYDVGETCIRSIKSGKNWGWLVDIEADSVVRSVSRDR
jgi:hypothetical protein